MFLVTELEEKIEEFNRKRKCNTDEFDDVKDAVLFFTDYLSDATKEINSEIGLVMVSKYDKKDDCIKNVIEDFVIGDMDKLIINFDKYYDEEKAQDFIAIIHSHPRLKERLRLFLPSCMDLYNIALESNEALGEKCIGTIADNKSTLACISWASDELLKKMEKIIEEMEKALEEGRELHNIEFKCRELFKKEGKIIRIK